MDFGIANGAYLGTNSGAIQGTQTGINSGLAQGMYNDELIQRGIVRDGLVFYIDATLRSSYPGSGITWRDLNGTNNATLTNTPTFNSLNQGSILFNGSNQFASTTTNYNLSAATWSCWINANLSTLSFSVSRRIMAQSTSSGPHEINLLIQTNNTFGWYGYGANAYSWFLSTPTINLNQWYNLVGTYDANNAYIYLNGILINSAARTVAISNANTGLYIGRVAWIGWGFFSGLIGSCSIYNRILSGGEVAQNFLATKKIYNL